MSDNNLKLGILILMCFVVLLGTINIKTGLSFETIIRTISLWFLFGGFLWLNKISTICSYWNFLLAIFLMTLIPIANELGTTMELTKEGMNPLLDNRTNIDNSKWYAEAHWQFVIIMAAALSKYVFAWMRMKSQV